MLVSRVVSELPMGSLKFEFFDQINRDFTDVNPNDIFSQSTHHFVKINLKFILDKIIFFTNKQIQKTKM